MVDVSGSIIQLDLAALKTLISKVISQFVITADGEFFFLQLNVVQNLVTFFRFVFSS